MRRDVTLVKRRSCKWWAGDISAKVLGQDWAWSVGRTTRKEADVAEAEPAEVGRMMRARNYWGVGDVISWRALLDHCKGVGFDSEWLGSHWRVLHRAVEQERRAEARMILKFWLL